MFTNAAIDIAKRQNHDPILAYVYNQDTQVVFLEYEHLLESVFTAKSIKPGDTFIMMEKQTFIQMLNEIGFLIHPKKPTPEEEKKQKEAREAKVANKQLTPDQEALLAEKQDGFAEAEVAACIQMVGTFDMDCLDYYNFLECIVRVVKARPYTEEEEKEIPDFQLKVDRICS